MQREEKQGEEQAWQLYERGNVEFRRGEAEVALALYERALQQLDASGGAPQDENKSSVSLRTRLCSNAALCHSSLRNFQESVVYCDKVLALDCSNVKAFIRRSKAHEQLGNFALALRDINCSLEIFRRDPEGRYDPILFPRPVCSAEHEAVSNMLRLQRQITLDLEVQRSQVNLRPTSFVTAEQSQRLQFGSPIPPVLHVGHIYSFRLYVSNEFGLWNRENIGAGLAPSVICDTIWLNLNTMQQDNFRMCVTSNTTLAQNGRVDFTFTFESCKNTKLESCDDGNYALLRFSCDGLLPSGHTVSPVVSLPIFIESSRSDTKSNSEDCSSLRDLVSKCHRLCGQSIKVYNIVPPTLPQASRNESLIPIYALECPGSLGIGGKVWDATFGMLEYFANKSHWLRGKVVIELGSGTGLAGLGLCNIDRINSSSVSNDLGSILRVILTDIEEVFPLLNLNIDLNKVLCPLSTAHCDELIASKNTIYDVCVAMEHIWGESIDDLNAAVAPCFKNESFSGLLIVASDVVYDPAGYQPLVNSISKLLHYHLALFLNRECQQSEVVLEAPMMVLTHRNRNKDNAKFFELLHAKEANLIVDKQDISWEQTPDDVELFVIQPKLS